MARSTNFLRWYRTIPLLLVALSAVLALMSAATPKALLRRFLYPLDYRDTILASSERHGVDAALVCAVIKCESNWDPAARSQAGAIGLMQLMPDTAHTVAAMGLVAPVGDDELTDPATNIEYGCAYLGYLQQNLTSRDEVIAAYNAGIGAVQAWLSGGAPDVADVIAYPETRLYLVRVNDAYVRYQQLYDDRLDPR